MKIGDELHGKNIFAYRQDLDLWIRGLIGVGEGTREDNGGKYE